MKRTQENEFGIKQDIILGSVDQTPPFGMHRIHKICMQLIQVGTCFCPKTLHVVQCQVRGRKMEREKGKGRETGKVRERDGVAEHPRIQYHSDDPSFSVTSNLYACYFRIYLTFLTRGWYSYSQLVDRLRGILTYCSRVRNQTPTVEVTVNRQLGYVITSYFKGNNTVSFLG